MAKPSWHAVGIQWKLDQNPDFQFCNTWLSPNQTKLNKKNDQIRLNQQQPKHTKTNHLKTPNSPKPNQSVHNQSEQNENQPNQTKNQPKYIKTKQTEPNQTKLNLTYPKHTFNTKPNLT